jgi:hypothetical protein
MRPSVTRASHTGGVLPRRLGCSAAVTAVLAATAPAWAAEGDSLARPPVVTPVYELARPDYDPPGIEIGSFLLSPSVPVTLAGNDNIFASDRHVASDLILTTGQDLKLGPQWKEDEASLHLYHAHDLYFDHQTENGNTYGVDGSFHLGISRTGYLQLDAGFVQQPQKRNSPQSDQLAIVRPIYNSIPASLSFSQDYGHWNNRAEVGILQTSYISEAQASRRSLQWRYRDRLSYALGGDVWPYLQIAYTTQNWEERSTLRNFDTLTGMAGLSVQITDMVDLDLGAGVLRQHYRFAGFPDLVTPAFNGHLIWNILPLTTIQASAERTVTGLETFCDAAPTNPACIGLPPSTLSAISALRGTLEVTSGEIGIEHEFWHDILGHVQFRVEQDKFDPVDLVDKNYVVNVGTRFLLNRNMEVDASYALNIRTANQDILLYNSGPYQADIVSLTLKAAL